MNSIATPSEVNTCAKNGHVYVCIDGNFEDSHSMPFEDDLADGQVHEISETTYRQYRDADQKPAAYRIDWRGKKWDFCVAGSYDFLYLFSKSEGRFWAIKTDLLDPIESGISVEQQIATPECAKTALDQRFNSMAALWLPMWRRLAENIVGKSLLGDRRKVTVCSSDSQLKSILLANQNVVGDFVVREDLCFILVDENESEWAVLKGKSKLERCNLKLLDNDRSSFALLLASLRNSNTRATAEHRS